MAGEFSSFFNGAEFEAGTLALGAQPVVPVEASALTEGAEALVTLFHHH